MTQTGSELKRPGESLTLSCKVSGFTFSSRHWVRQAPGKGLEWIGRVNSGSGNKPLYAESLKGQFVLTEDVPSNMQYLEAKSLKPEDTAVYYGAQD
uniref:Immunoglobulin heavy variable 1-2 n=1 Tax=Lepisosteus oculatus TaxID=7918 RepID=W5LZD4_LEPOC